MRGSTPGDLTVGPDGNLWFPEYLMPHTLAILPGQGRIGRVDPSQLSVTGVVTVAHSRKGITSILLGFNEALDPVTAGKRRSYSLAAGVKSGGKHRLQQGREDRKGVLQSHREHGEAQAGQAAEGADPGDGPRRVEMGARTDPP